MTRQEKYYDTLYYKTSEQKIRFAKRLRKNMTPAEEKLWEVLKGRKVVGQKFRRQHVIGQFVADFYCHQAKLVIEVDGEIHNLIENKRYDATRSEILKESGITILRFTNDEVLNSVENVIEKIKENLKNNPLPYSPSP